MEAKTTTIRFLEQLNEYALFLDRLSHGGHSWSVGYHHGTEENLTEKELAWIALQIYSEELVYNLRCSQTSHRKGVSYNNPTILGSIRTSK